MLKDAAEARASASAAAQPPPREVALMGMLVWVMMGIAIWHFTIFLPDRFWGGIVGAFVGALAGRGRRRPDRSTASRSPAARSPARTRPTSARARGDPGGADRAGRRVPRGHAPRTRPSRLALTPSARAAGSVVGAAVPRVARCAAIRAAWPSVAPACAAGAASRARSVRPASGRARCGASSALSAHARAGARAPRARRPEARARVPRGRRGRTTRARSRASARRSS